MKTDFKWMRDFDGMLLGGFKFKLKLNCIAISIESTPSWIWISCVFE